MLKTRNATIGSLLLLLILSISTTCYSQLIFQVDNEHPCPGEWFTVSLPASCTYQRLVRTQLSITPAPDEIVDIVDHTIRHEGVVGVRILYKTYRTTTIDVHGPYTCNGTTSGTIGKTLRMSPPVSITPVISGLDARIYSGDRSTASATYDNSDGSSNQPAYSWQLTIISVVSGNIYSTAIASPASRETAITWPKDFVGVVDVKVTSTRCSVSKQYVKRISVLAPPAPFIYATSALPPIYCPGTKTRYRITTSNNTFSFTRVILIPSTGISVALNALENNVPVEWTVTWNNSGTVKVDYTVSDGTRTWNGVMPPISASVAKLNGGRINPIPAGTYCSPYSVNVSLAESPSSNEYAWQYCSSGDCTPTSAGWINNANVSSSSFPDLMRSTSFRIKLNETRCGLVTSNVVSMAVQQTPKIIASDKTIFSGKTFDIPVSDVPLALITVSTNASGVQGASDFTTLQGATTSGILKVDTLVTSGNSDGIVNYLLKATSGACSSTKPVTVTVYKKPVIYADRNLVYKGLSATLSTDKYDSYQWWADDGRLLSNQPSYRTAEPGSFRLVVMRNGLKGESDILTVGNQFYGIKKNYIITRMPLRKMTSEADLSCRPETEVMESIQYFDGMSRPLQTVNTRISPSHFDLVQPVSYDQFGRETTKYLSYVSSQDNGRYQENATTDQQIFYKSNDDRIARDPAPYSQSLLDDSPLNRILKQGSPGTDWQPDASGVSPDHAMKFEYSLNMASDSIMRFSYNASTSSLAGLLYPPGVLLRNKVIDEEKNDVIEFVDKLNRAVCKKVKAGNNVYATTYYVYDDIGNLVVVIPPEGVRSLKTLP